MTKNEIRKSTIAERGALPKEVVAEKSNLITAKLVELPEYEQAQTLMVYIDFRNEVQTRNIIQHALSHGKRVTIPVTDVKQKRLTPSLLKHFPGDLTPGTWGILEPKPQSFRPVAPEEIDLVLVPGVAFDVQGNRLGYGGGFYDRFLPRTKPDTIYIALAFELQVKNNVCPGDYDVPMHMLVTEEMTRKFTRQ